MRNIDAMILDAYEKKVIDFFMSNTLPCYFVFKKTPIL